MEKEKKLMDLLNLSRSIHVIASSINLSSLTPLVIAITNSLPPPFSSITSSNEPINHASQPKFPLFNSTRVKLLSIHCFTSQNIHFVSLPSLLFTKLSNFAGNSNEKLAAQTWKRFFEYIDEIINSSTFDDHRHILNKRPLGGNWTSSR